MDGSGESGGFSRTMGDKIACRSKDAGHTWFAVWIAHASQGGSRRSRIPLGERKTFDGSAVKSAFALLLTKVTKPAAGAAKGILNYNYCKIGGDRYKTNYQCYVGQGCG